MRKCRDTGFSRRPHCDSRPPLYTKLLSLGLWLGALSYKREEKEWLATTVIFIVHKSINVSIHYQSQTSLPSLTSRPPDRRRRDLFGVANSTHSRRSRLHSNSTVPPLQAAGNSSTISDLEPADREFEFMEQAVTERELQISGLQPFTVYRIDIHACNRQVQRCSAAEFVFSRTKPAG